MNFLILAISACAGLEKYVIITTREETTNCKCTNQGHPNKPQTILTISPFPTEEKKYKQKGRDKSIYESSKVVDKHLHKEQALLSFPCSV